METHIGAIPAKKSAVESKTVKGKQMGQSMSGMYTTTHTSTLLSFSEVE